MATHKSTIQLSETTPFYTKMHPGPKLIAASLRSSQPLMVFRGKILVILSYRLSYCSLEISSLLLVTLILHVTSHLSGCVSTKCSHQRMKQNTLTFKDEGEKKVSDHFICREINTFFYSKTQTKNKKEKLKTTALSRFHRIIVGQHLSLFKNNSPAILNPTLQIKKALR